eukprot:8669559-Pyramimonas_sp.AAC.1
MSRGTRRPGRLAQIARVSAAGTARATANRPSVAARTHARIGSHKPNSTWNGVVDGRRLSGARRTARAGR